MMLLFSCWELTYHNSIGNELARVTKCWQADLLSANGFAIMQISLFSLTLGCKKLWLAYAVSGVQFPLIYISRNVCDVIKQWCNINGGFGNHYRLEEGRLRGLQFGEKVFADWWCSPRLLVCVCLLFMCVCVCVCVCVGWHLCAESEDVCAKPFTASVYSLFKGVWFSSTCLSSIFSCIVLFSPISFLFLHSSLTSFLSLSALASFLMSFVVLNPPSLHPSESYQCLRSCVRRVKGAREHDTQSLKRGVIGPVQSHGNNISNLCFLFLSLTHRHTNHLALPRKLPVLRGCVWGMSSAGEHDMLIKERSYWPGPLAQRK